MTATDELVLLAGVCQPAINRLSTLIGRLHGTPSASSVTRPHAAAAAVITSRHHHLYQRHYHRYHHHYHAVVTCSNILLELHALDQCITYYDTCSLITARGTTQTVDCQCRVDAFQTLRLLSQLTCEVFRGSAVPQTL